MPLYEYECQKCGKHFEKIQKFSDEPLEVCALCGKGPVHKLMSSPAIQFKGSGWYITDYAKKGQPAPKGDAAKSDASKSDAKAEPKSDKPEKSSSDTSKAAPASTAAKD